MKKKEAEILAVQKVDVIMEYIIKVLDDSEKVSSLMNFNSIKIDGQNMCTFDIYVSNNNFERHLNLGITSDHINVIFREFLNRVITEIFNNQTIGATRFYHLRSSFNSFDGITILNSIGSEIKINMYGIDKSISDEYNMRYDEYKNNLLGEESDISKKRI